MSPGVVNPPYVLLKARPVPEQLADRLAAPRPPGMELYLDLRDLEDAEAVERTVEQVRTAVDDRDFIWLVEGPIRSLDGEFFDVTRDAEADRELVALLAEVAQRIGARTVNVHVIAPRASDHPLPADARQTSLEQAARFLTYFASRCVDRGIRPTVENMPPVLRMRESAYYVSPIGMAVQDLRWLVGEVPELRVTLDYSHAQLYLNAAQRAAEPDGIADYPALGPLLRAQLAPDSVGAYREQLEDSLLACHVSNAAGLLGEGEPYDSGDIDFDPEIAAASEQVTYFVTETLEPDPAHARYMRLAQNRLEAAVRRTR